MNNSIVVRKVVSRFFCGSLTILLYSYCINVNKGLPGASNSIEMSKKNGVFLCEYKPLQNPLIIDTFANCNFQSIWIEKRWRYGENGKAIPFEDHSRGDFQLIIQTDDSCKTHYTSKWYVAYDKYNNLRVAGEHFFTMDVKLPLDTFFLPVLIGDYYEKNARYDNKSDEIILIKIK